MSETENRPRLSAVERAEAELAEDRRDLGDHATVQPDDFDGFEDRLANVVRSAQNVILARLKTKAIEVSGSYDNSPETDAWEDAIQAADPSEYSIGWEREWQR